MPATWSSAPEPPERVPDEVRVCSASGARIYITLFSPSDNALLLVRRWCHVMSRGWDALQSLHAVTRIKLSAGHS